MKQIYAENYRQIGLKIAYYRKLRGLTQEELAEQTGLTPAFIGHLEAPNIQKPFLWTLFLILHLYYRLPLTNFLLLMSCNKILAAGFHPKQQFKCFFHF